ncbi:Uroporphyrinogen decarboxylase [Dokdonella koreensis DS-123]|uniref:Uroporphyrinogen decarboxylase n=2 Tax=Dokdonella TaxID=323413 RepID=A0A167H0H1_9GAMM|nr:uroporphyrinogen decarboxylase [Dokdonella koreensis]ANB18376.1 Uroporphyrinogen decarboxylase [Dokdonella koreensis DS-123]
MTLKNDRLLRALRRQPVDRTPVWIMRQAGRYLPEYRATRARAGSFLALAKTPELACEVTLQPIDRFPLDAAILFSDILTIPDAMGLELYFVDGEGPKFRHPLRDAAAIARLGVPDPERDLRYVTDAVRLIRRELDGRVPLIGFSGSPWTLACYMVQGEGSSDFSHAKALLWDDPASLHRLLDVNARAVAAYLAAQAAAGAQALMIFDTWGGLLGPGPFLEFSLRYLHRVVEALKADPVARELPLIVFSKGANGHLEALAGTGCDALGLDWTITLGEARTRVGDRVALQGNLDPSVLYARPETIRAEAAAALASFGGGPGHVFNLGHGITPQVDPDHLRVLIDAVHDWRPAGS